MNSTRHYRSCSLYSFSLVLIGFAALSASPGFALEGDIRIHSRGASKSIW